MYAIRSYYGSIGLGMLDFIPTVEVGRVRVRKGAKLLAFTDGIVELDDGSQVESGTEDIERILANSNSLDENFEELNVEVDALLEKGSVFDDISLLGMEFIVITSYSIHYTKLYDFQLQSEKLKLRKEVQQAYADATASYKQYLASEEAVKSYEESFAYTQKRFDLGMVTSVDYNIAKTDYTKAQLDLLQAKYEYILRSKILDFYNGKPIQL